MYRRNVTDSDGILLPSKEEPLVDGITGATPKEEMRILIRPNPILTQFRIFIEVNQSTDFNNAWPESANKGDANWSGGPEGSGQPAVVYSALIDLSNPGPWILSIDGHSSGDGSDGVIRSDVSNLDSALHILGSAKVEMIP